MPTPHLNMVVGWLGMLAGIGSGAVIGLLFAREDWMGGYAAFPRRMVRLAHISFFGLGFLNILFSLSASQLALGAPALRVASAGLIFGAITMPTVCLLTAWRRAFRHLFALPVLAIIAAVVTACLP